MRDALAACGTSLAFGVLGIVLLVAGARWGMPASIDGPIADGGWTARTRAWFITDGFSDPPEMDKATLHQFSWTIRRASRLLMPNLDRSRGYALTLHVLASRPPGVPLPTLRVLVDGAVRGTIQTSNDYQNVTAELPSRSDAGAVVTLDVSETWVPATVLPGSGDKRTLGVMVDDISIAPIGGHYGLVWPVIALAALAIALAVAGVLWCGLRSWLGAAAALFVTVGFTWLLLQDAAFIGTFVERLLHVSIGVAIIGAIVAVMRARWPTIAALPEWSIAVGIVLCVSAVKLASFVHPLATIGDAVFQVHNLQNVHAGGYFFTSKTPRPFF
jgi:hypothetical protein